MDFLDRIQLRTHVYTQMESYMEQAIMLAQAALGRARYCDLVDYNGTHEVEQHCLDVLTAGLLHPSRVGGVSMPEVGVSMPPGMRKNENKNNDK